MHILLVEDDDRVAAALRSALHRHGMSLTRLDRGRGVTDHLAGVDVVLLDLGLPDIDGVDVCRAIRAVSDVPVIVVSARGEVDDRILGLHSGADDYLVKPYDVGELVARVHAVYRRRRVRSAAPSAAAPRDVVELDDVTIDLAPAYGNRRRQVGDAEPEGVPGAGDAGQLGRRGVHPEPDRGRGVGPHLGRRQPHARRAHRHPAHQAGPRGPDPDRARRRLPARPAGQPGAE